MNRNIITISENGTVSVPSEVRMNMTEIANLLGIFYQTAKAAVRAIEKSGIACGDYSTGGTVEGLKIYPDYYGLDMIIAVAFRVQSPKTEIFRKWVLKRSIAVQNPSPPLFIRLPYDTVSN